MALLTGPALTILSPTGGSSLPFTLGHAFKLGDVPSGSTLQSTSVSSFQCVIQNAWPDGSAKFAILSGIGNFTAGVALPISLDTTASSALAGLTTTQLKATGITTQVDVTTIGTASWAGVDWDTPFLSNVAGPTMTSWIYRKPVGSDAHLVAWLEVRLYSNGAVDVLPWVENGYLNVAAPANKNATYSFTLGGSQRFSQVIDLKHHQRTPLVSGTALSYWLGTDPDVIPLPDKTYLQKTELVPTYSSTTAPGGPAFQRQPTTYTPLQIGGFVYDTDNMASTGYQPPIGVLPEHDAIYLAAPAADTAALYKTVQRNGYSAGRYSIHYRDQNTNRPLRFSQWPTLVIGDGQGFKDNGSSTTSSYTPVPTGGNGPTWDVAHSPSTGYMAYLLTGRWYFMEEVQFNVTVNYLGNGSNAILRNGAQNLIRPCDGAWQTRSTAWSWRTLVQALTVTPDSDTALRTEFTNSVQFNVDHFHSVYVAQANNPFGMIAPGESYGKMSSLSAWQQDFVTAAFGYSVALRLPLTPAYRTKLSQFFQWKAGGTVGRLSEFNSGGYPYGNAAVYILSVSATASPNFANGTGPWRTSWADVWAAQPTTLSDFGSPTNWISNTPGSLYGEIVPGERSQWGNLMTALAYCVRFGVPGAQEGLNRIKAASNYPALTTAFNVFPVWAVSNAEVVADPDLGLGYTGPTTRIRKPAEFVGQTHVGSRGAGVLGAVVRATTATGTHGPGALYEQLPDSSDDNREVSIRVTQQPASGKVFVYNDGSYVHSDANDGTWMWKAQLVVQGVPKTPEIEITDIIGGATGTTPFTFTVSRGSSSVSGTFTSSAAGSISSAILTRAATAVAGSFSSNQSGNLVGVVTRQATDVSGSYSSSEASAFNATVTLGSTSPTASFSTFEAIPFAMSVSRGASVLEGSYTSSPPEGFAGSIVRASTQPGGVFQSLTPTPFTGALTRQVTTAAGTFVALAPLEVTMGITREATSVTSSFASITPNPDELPTKVNPNLSERNNMLALLNRASRGPVYSWDDLRVLSVEPHTAGEGEEHPNNTKMTLEGVGNYQGIVELLYRRIEMEDALDPDNGVIPERRLVYDSAGETAENFRSRIVRTFGLCYSPSDPQRGVVIPFQNASPNTEVQITITPHRGDNNWIFLGSLTITVVVVSGMTASSNAG